MKKKKKEAKCGGRGEQTFSIWRIRKEADGKAVKKKKKNRGGKGAQLSETQQSGTPSTEGTVAIFDRIIVMSNKKIHHQEETCLQAPTALPATAVCTVYPNSQIKEN